MATTWRPSFVFAACQHGAEAVLKNELAARRVSLRPAFARPGIVTLKIETPIESLEGYSLASPFARTWGFSFGSVKGDRLEDLARAVWALPEVINVHEHLRFAGMHVWQRDARRPGEDGFEPGPTALSAEAERSLREISPIEPLRVSDETQPAPVRRSRWALDVVLIEPNHWLAGAHFTSTRAAAWPGGVPPIVLPDYAVSRAYLKMAEALKWSALPMTVGEHVVELGCAPGGASQALLDAGLVVTGIDPAEVHEEVLAHPRFQHVRLRTSKVPRKLFKDVKWLAADMNVAPAYTLNVVKSLVSHDATSIRGMLLTLKLADWGLAANLPQYVEEVRSWGYRDVRVRQLAFNRQEVCLVALRSRGQRRILRGASSRPRRIDSRHASTPPPHFDAPRESDVD